MFKRGTLLIDRKDIFMRRERQEQLMQRIMAVICLLLIILFVFNAIRDGKNATMTDEDKQIESLLNGELTPTPATTATE